MVASQTSAIAVPESVEDQIQLIRNTYYKELTDAEYQLMTTEAHYRGLDPIKKEYAAIAFGEGDKRTVAFFPTIHGLRKLALESGGLDGSVSQWCGADGVWKDIWLSKEPPVGARCSVWVKGASHPFVGIATYDERRRTYYDRYTKQQVLMKQWKEQPAHMLAKCAEADALRKSGLIAGVKIPELAANSDAFLDGGVITATVQEAPENPNRHAHKAASAALGAGRSGAAHELVRETVQAFKPELESLRDATPEDLRQAAEVLEAFGEAAPDVVAGATTQLVIDADGNASAEPSAREQFAILAREMVDAEGASAWKKLRELAGEDIDRWDVLITNRKISNLTMARRLRDEFIRVNMPAGATQAPVALMETANAMLERREDIERTVMSASQRGAEQFPDNAAKARAARNGGAAGNGR